MDLTSKCELVLWCEKLSHPNHFVPEGVLVVKSNVAAQSEFFQVPRYLYAGSALIGLRLKLIPEQILWQSVNVALAYLSVFTRIYEA